MDLPWHIIPVLDVGKQCKEVPDSGAKDIINKNKNIPEGEM